MPLWLAWRLGSCTACFDMLTIPKRCRFLLLLPDPYAEQVAPLAQCCQLNCLRSCHAMQVA